MPAEGMERLRGMKVHGLDLSYFTGKFEAFVRYREIPHQRVEMDIGGMCRAARMTGLAQTLSPSSGFDVEGRAPFFTPGTVWGDVRR